jgi:hypothetical protein
MVSNTFVAEEGWPWIDALGTDVCQAPSRPRNEPPMGKALGGESSSATKVRKVRARGGSGVNWSHRGVSSGAKGGGAKSRRKLNSVASDATMRHEDERSWFYPDKKMPTFLHYCQFFRAGEIGFQKRRVRKELFECHKPMLLELPTDQGNCGSVACCLRG